MTQKYHTISHKISWKFVEKRWYTRWILNILILCFCWNFPNHQKILRPEQGGRNEVAKKVTWTNLWKLLDRSCLNRSKSSSCLSGGFGVVNLSGSQTFHRKRANPFRQWLGSLIDELMILNPGKNRCIRIELISLVKVHATWRWLCRTRASAWPAGSDVDLQKAKLSVCCLSLRCPLFSANFEDDFPFF